MEPPDYANRENLARSSSSLHLNFVGMRRLDLLLPPDPLDLNIDVSSAELKDGTLSPSNVQLGTLLLATRGYVILRGAVPRDLVTELRNSFTALFEENADRREAGITSTPIAEERQPNKSVFWERGSRFRIFPKITGPFADPFVIRNPFAEPILRETLGTGFYCKFLSSDTCVKGSTTQAPHRDIDFYDGDAAFGSLINIPLMHCGLHNGPTEVWPGGSHLWRSEKIFRFNLRPFVQDERNPPVENLAKHLPSKLIELHPGELLIRDPGMWHRGTANATEEPRTMLTAGYFRKDYYYEYGDPLYNLDENLFRQLEPSAQELFAPFFDRTDFRYWRATRHRALRTLGNKPVLGAPLRAATQIADHAKRTIRNRRATKTA